MGMLSAHTEAAKVLFTSVVSTGVTQMCMGDTHLDNMMNTSVTVV